MSVSYCGSEIGLDEALDQCFLGLQQNLNNAHVFIREMVMGVDRNESYEHMLRKTLEINDEIDSMTDLFKELKSVTKQVLGTPQASEKAAMKKIVDEYKAAKKKIIDDKKAAEALVKSMAASTM
jgi:hypothetical protein